MTEVQPAAPKLRDLAVASRPDWDREKTWNALLAAHAAGWPFARALREITRLLLIEDSSPDDLRFAAGETRADRPGHLPDDLRASVLTAAGDATRRLREQARASEGGTAA